MTRYGMTPELQHCLRCIAVGSTLQDIFSKVDKSGEGVCVQASTLGSLEALLAFLDSPDVSS